MTGIMVVAAGGALGAVARYLVAAWVEGLTGPAFPWGTLTVNVAGSFLLGFVMVWLHTQTTSVEARQLVTVGFLGSFTTFSTYSYQTVTLLREGAHLRAGVYAMGSLVLGLVGVLAGITLARLLIGPSGGS